MQSNNQSNQPINHVNKLYQSTNLMSQPINHVDTTLSINPSNPVYQSSEFVYPIKWSNHLTITEKTWHTYITPTDFVMYL